MQPWHFLRMQGSSAAAHACSLTDPASTSTSCGVLLQDAGTAMWLFAWFGYWLDVFLVLAIRGVRGSLTDAKAKYDLRHGQDSQVIKASNQVNRDLHPHHPKLWGDAEDPKAAYRDPKLARSSDEESSSSGSGGRISDEKPVPLRDPPKDIELSQV